MLVFYWSRVPETTIINCFRRAGFKEVQEDDEEKTDETLMKPTTV